MMLTSTSNPTNSTTEQLKASKLGLATVMFVYVCIACFLPILILHLLDKYSKKSDRSIDQNGDEAIESNGVQRPIPNEAKRHLKCSNWSQETRQKLVSLANCLAAGAFLSVGLLDVFMDTMESVEDAKKALKIKTEIPIASLLTLIGFFLVLGVEQIAMTLYERQSHKHLSGVHKQLEQRGLQGVLIRRVSSCRSSDRSLTPGLTGMSEQLTIFPNPNECVTDKSCDHPGSGSIEQVHNHDGQLTFLKRDVGWIQAMTLLFALSLHSIFEGLALGLCDSITSLLTLFAALSLHKLVIAISIGINLASEMSDSSQTEDREFCHQFKTKTQILRLLAVLLFAGASPLGCLIGWAISERSQDTAFLAAEAILQGLACGTFFYVVFCELLPKEFKETQNNKIAKFIFLVLGFVIIALVICLVPDE